MIITDKDRLDFLDRNRFEIFLDGSNRNFCVGNIYAPIFVEDDDNKIIGNSEKLRDAIDKAILSVKTNEKNI